jgi:hypothetical protein
VTRFDIEIRPTFAQVNRGHRLRLTVTTSDLPTLLPTVRDETNLIGGIYEVQRNRRAASYVELLSVPASRLGSGLRARAQARHVPPRRPTPAPSFTG